MGRSTRSQDAYGPSTLALANRSSSSLAAALTEQPGALNAETHQVALAPCQSASWLAAAYIPPSAAPEQPQAREGSQVGSTDMPDPPVLSTAGYTGVESMPSLPFSLNSMPRLESDALLTNLLDTFARPISSSPPSARPLTPPPAVHASAIPAQAQCHTPGGLHAAQQATVQAEAGQAADATASLHHSHALNGRAKQLELEPLPVCIEPHASNDIQTGPYLPAEPVATIGTESAGQGQGLKIDQVDGQASTAEPQQGSVVKDRGLLTAAVSQPSLLDRRMTRSAAAKAVAQAPQAIVSEKLGRANDVDLAVPGHVRAATATDVRRAAKPPLPPSTAPPTRQSAGGAARPTRATRASTGTAFAQPAVSPFQQASEQQSDPHVRTDPASDGDKSRTAGRQQGAATTHQVIPATTRSGAMKAVGTATAGATLRSTKTPPPVSSQPQHKPLTIARQGSSGGAARQSRLARGLKDNDNMPERHDSLTLLANACECVLGGTDLDAYTDREDDHLQQPGQQQARQTGGNAGQSTGVGGGNQRQGNTGVITSTAQLLRSMSQQNKLNPNALEVPKTAAAPSASLIRPVASRATREQPPRAVYATASAAAPAPAPAATQPVHPGTNTTAPQHQLVEAAEPLKQHGSGGAAQMSGAAQVSGSRVVPGAQADGLPVNLLPAAVPAVQYKPRGAPHASTQAAPPVTTSIMRLAGPLASAGSGPVQGATQGTAKPSLLPPGWPGLGTGRALPGMQLPAPGPITAAASASVPSQVLAALAQARAAAAEAAAKAVAPRKGAGSLLQKYPIPPEVVAAIESLNNQPPAASVSGLVNQPPAASVSGLVAPSPDRSRGSKKGTGGTPVGSPSRVVVQQVRQPSGTVGAAVPFSSSVLAAQNPSLSPAKTQQPPPAPFLVPAAPLSGWDVSKVLGAGAGDGEVLAGGSKPGGSGRGRAAGSKRRAAAAVSEDGGDEDDEELGMMMSDEEDEMDEVQLWEETIKVLEAAKVPVPPALSAPPQPSANKTKPTPPTARDLTAHLPADQRPAAMTRIRREKNRLAARKCRAKKQESMAETEKRVADLRLANQMLEQQVVSLQQRFCVEQQQRVMVQVLLDSWWDAGGGLMTRLTEHLPPGIRTPADIVAAIESGAQDAHQLMALLQQGLSESNQVVPPTVAAHTGTSPITPQQQQELQQPQPPPESPHAQLPAAHGAPQVEPQPSLLPALSLPWPALEPCLSMRGPSTSDLLRTASCMRGSLPLQPLGSLSVDIATLTTGPAGGLSIGGGLAAQVLPADDARLGRMDSFEILLQIFRDPADLNQIVQGPASQPTSTSPELPIDPLVASEPIAGSLTPGLSMDRIPSMFTNTPLPEAAAATTEEDGLLRVPSMQLPNTDHPPPPSLLAPAAAAGASEPPVQDSTMPSTNPVPLPAAVPAANEIKLEPGVGPQGPQEVPPPDELSPGAAVAPAPAATHTAAPAPAAASLMGTRRPSLSAGRTITDLVSQRQHSVPEAAPTTDAALQVLANVGRSIKQEGVGRCGSDTQRTGSAVLSKPTRSLSSVWDCLDKLLLLPQAKHNVHKASPVTGQPVGGTSLLNTAVATAGQGHPGRVITALERRRSGPLVPRQPADMQRGGRADGGVQGGVQGVKRQRDETGDDEDESGAPGVTQNMPAAAVQTTAPAAAAAAQVKAKRPKRQQWPFQQGFGMNVWPGFNQLQQQKQMGVQHPCGQAVFPTGGGQQSTGGGYHIGPWTSYAMPVHPMQAMPHPGFPMQPQQMRLGNRRATQGSSGGMDPAMAVMYAAAMGMQEQLAAWQQQQGGLSPAAIQQVAMAAAQAASGVIMSRSNRPAAAPGAPITAPAAPQQRGDGGGRGSGAAGAAGGGDTIAGQQQQQQQQEACQSLPSQHRITAPGPGRTSGAVGVVSGRVGQQVTAAVTGPQPNDSTELATPAVPQRRHDT